MKTYEYSIYVCTYVVSFFPRSHLSGETQANRPNTFPRGELLSAHDTVYISRPAPRASGISNSHELRARDREQERDDGVSPIFHLSVKMDVPRFIRLRISSPPKPAARADAESRRSRRLIATSRTAVVPDPSMRKIGVRAHEWSPAVNKVAAR